MAEDKKKIGQFLIDRGHIEPQDLASALDIQRESGSKVGEILQSQGKISAYKFYLEMADFMGKPFVDLEKYNINASILRADERHDYYQNDYLPFDIDADGTIFVATTNPSADLLLHLSRTYEQYKLFITSPFDILWTLQKHFIKENDEDAKAAISANLPITSAKNITISKQGLINIAIASAICFFAVQNDFLLKVFLLAINIFFFSTLISKAVFFFAGAFAKKEKYTEETLDINEQELPIYTILVPLYKEKRATIIQLTSAIKNLNYPLAKLDIKLITELDDDATINIIKSMGLESNFQIIRVPHSIPKTKPKACNYALRFAKGEFVTIYDAEDIPDQNQLKKTYLAFRNEPQDNTALQCQLNFYNRNENFLSRFFSMEYASWFQFMLYGLERLKLPIPLGGTSNHFRTTYLKNIRAWDAYNVTEDAELGMRISLGKGNIKVVNSTTMEECPYILKNWLQQRTRWIKGYMQTFAAYMLQPANIIKNFGIKKFLGFFFFIGAPFLTYMLAPLAIMLYFIALVHKPDLHNITSFLYFNLFFGIALHIFIGLVVVVKNRWWDLLIHALLFPLYWVLHSIASYIAVFEIVKKPHHWNKTEHGLSKIKPEL
jgi:cellulose synthase/poly-beta-1,6-N-acetylglucosamine synthase-like glycosyltransferase